MLNLRIEKVRFQVLTTASMKMRVLWDIVPGSFVEVDGHFRTAYSLHCHGQSTYVPLYILLILLYSIYITLEPGSSGSIVSGYGLDDRAIEVRSLAEAK
jgi:hypothetical protein